MPPKDKLLMAALMGRAFNPQDLPGNTPIAGYLPEGQSWQQMQGPVPNAGNGTMQQTSGNSMVDLITALRNDPQADRNKMWTMTGPGGGFDMAKEAGFFGPQVSPEAKLASQGASAVNQWAQLGQVPEINQEVFAQAQAGRNVGPLAMLGTAPSSAPAARLQPQPFQQVGTWMPAGPGMEELLVAGKPIQTRPTPRRGMSALYR